MPLIIDTIKDSYAWLTGKNLPIFGVETDQLKYYKTYERDVKQGISWM